MVHHLITFGCFPDFATSCWIVIIWVNAVCFQETPFTSTNVVFRPVVGDFFTRIIPQYFLLRTAIMHEIASVTLNSDELWGLRPSDPDKCLYILF